MNFLGRTANYDEMLNRVAFGAFITAAVVTWRLRIANPALDGILSAVDAGLPAVGPLKDYDKLPTGTLVAGIAIALAFRIVKLHDRVSDLLLIRRSFDISNILIPVIGAFDLKLSEERRARLVKNRNHWMHELFYAYASSSEGKAKIDVSVIRQALDWWTWSWMALESAVILNAGSLVAYSSRAYRMAFELTQVSAVLVIVFYLLVRFACTRAATAEVRAILSDDARRIEIRKKLNAL
jgi:hypothetical protein